MLPIQQYAEFVSRAEVAELADARGSGPRTRKGVGVRVPSSAPKFFSFLYINVSFAPRVAMSRGIQVK